MDSPRTPPFPVKTAVELPSAPDPALDPEGYLNNLIAVRERSKLVYERVRTGSGKCFTLDEGKFDDVIRYVVGIIKVTHAGHMD
jgi:Protein of unknown function (DUF1688)